jgi:prepilin-type N-terminal cleavage/methylation domain-containing protein
LYVPTRRRLADESGFTLVELLVVMVIIGILASIGIAAFLNQRSKAQDGEARSMPRPPRRRSRSGTASTTRSPRAPRR